MTVKELLKLIPAGTFQELAAVTRIDHQVKKLSGELMFMLIAYSMLKSEKASLRVMEGFLRSAQFKAFSGFDIIDGKYNSIRDRICTMDVTYFEQLFHRVFVIYNKVLGEQKALSRVDSTTISLPARLLSGGMTNNSKLQKFLKYSLELKGSLPCSVKIFKDPTFSSEDRALAELINESEFVREGVVVFDRGLRARKTLDQFTSENKLFVTRAYAKMKYQATSSLAIPPVPAGSTLTIQSDEVAYLFSRHDRKTQHLYRVIKARVDKTGDPICFITNILDTSSYQIAEWYRQRWDIEVFFKFLKQHLNVKHLVSRDENGMKVMIYMTLIVAILILVYKKMNRIKFYKMARLEFELELDNELTKAIVILCGGDPERAPHLFTNNKTG